MATLKSVSSLEEISQEERRRIEDESARRLDSHLRWRNSQVDNTQRRWDSARGDFLDRLEGHPPEWDCSDGAGRQRDPEIWERLERLRAA